VFERFTDRARQGILEAQSEAIEQQVTFIGTEHLLLGLMRIGSGVAYEELAADGVETQVLREKVIARLGEVVAAEPPALSKADALAAIGIDLGAVKAIVEAAFGPGSLPDLGSTPAFTPRAKTALEGAWRRAQMLRHRFVGTEHVLLGLLGDRETYACLALGDVGVDLDRLSSRLLDQIAPAERRVDAAWTAVVALQLEGLALPPDRRDAAVPALAALSNALRDTLAAEQAEVVRLANETADALEAAVAAAQVALGAATG
jgi:ATP-dependent Clp protease ATP-binding subunit ClpC